MKLTNQTKFKETELGLIPEDWEVDKLGNRADVIMGQSPESKHFNENQEGLYFMQGVRTFGEKFPSFDTWTTKATKTAPAGSVLMSVRAPVGDLNIAHAEMCIGRGLAAVNAKNKNNEFIYQLLKAFSKKIIGQETGTVYGSISKDDLNNIELPFPHDDEQRKIAEVLGALDEKIELNRKMNKTLESLAQAIFKKWFIDDADPNWEIKKLGDLLDIDRGLSYKGKYLSDVGIPMFNLGSFNLDGSLKLDTLKYYSGDFKNNCTVNAGDIIVANTDMTQNRVILGSPCIIPDLFHDQNVLFTHHLYALRPVNEINKMFIYRSLKTREFKDQAIGFATGTTVLFLPKEAILSYEIKYPSIVRLEEFNSFYRNILKQQLVLTKEIETLSQIRDSLLPRLMSGKLRVK